MRQVPEQCPLCGATTTAGWQGEPGDEARDVSAFHCGRCGKYRVSFEAYHNLGTIETLFLRAATRQAFDRGRPLLLTTENLEALIAEHERTPIHRKIEKFVEHIALRTVHPGHAVNISYDFDYPVADGFDPSECEWLASAVQEMGLATKLGSSAFLLTPKGWASLAPIDGEPVKGRGFVAMSFDSSLNAAYTDGIRAAIEDDCGLDPIRTDQTEHNDKICDRIIVEIRRAQFVVADFTMHRGGVYFEAGFALALDRPVIWMCRDTDFDHLHFDTRQFNHIKWKEPADLRQQLAERIRGTIPGARLI